MIEQILASLGEYWLTLVAILLLICASAFFSGSFEATISVKSTPFLASRPSAA